MDQAASTPNPLSALERLQHWWQRLAAWVLTAPSEPGFDPATARLVDRLRALLKEGRAQRGGEISARRRVEQIAAVYRGASLPQRAVILNLITREFTRPSRVRNVLGCGRRIALGGGRFPAFGDSRPG